MILVKLNGSQKLNKTPDTHVHVCTRVHTHTQTKREKRDMNVQKEDVGRKDGGRGS